MSNKLKRKYFLRDDSLSQKVFYIISALMKDALSGVVKVGDAYVDLGRSGITRKLYQNFYGVDIFAKHSRKSKTKPEWEIKKVLKYLTQQKYIKISKEKQKIYLAEKGVVEFIKFKAIQKQEKWDGKWRIIIFDVAENRRGSRDFLRKQLKWIGFKELQKSVWIFPFNVKDDINDLMAISKYKYRDDVRFLVVERIEEDQDLKKWFDLK